MPDRPFSDDERDQVRRLHAEGRGRNEIARRTGINHKRVSYIAAELGLTFKRSPHVREAVEAKKEDARARRAVLALRLLEDAERLRRQLFAPVQVYNFGGRDNTFETAIINQPSMRDQREIMSAVGIAVDRAVRLDEYDSGAGLGQVASLLDQLGKGLIGKYGTGDDEHPVDTTAPADA